MNLITKLGFLEGNGILFKCCSKISQTQKELFTPSTKYSPKETFFISKAHIRQSCIRLEETFKIKDSASYIQGQSPEPKIREYFYYVDHQGMLFLDDARIKNFTSCFKERKFLVFFFSRVQPNTTGRYPDFPFYSPCGRERNYLRCDDLPFVFTHVVGDTICYGHAGDDLKEPFQPNMVTMVPETGRVYHPAPVRAGGAGLVKSSLAIDFSNRFRFENGESEPPTHFKWNDITYQLVTWYHPKF